MLMVVAAPNALMVVAVVLQAASVVNVDLALWLGPGAGLGVYGITPYNAVALCMGVLLLGRLVTVGVAVPVQVRGAAAWFVAYAVVAALGAVLLPRVFAGTHVHDMLALYGMSQPPVPVKSNDIDSSPTALTPIAPVPLGSIVRPT